MKVYGQIEKAQLESLASDPASPPTGYIYFNTTSNRMRFYNGSSWKDLENDLTTHEADTSTHGVSGDIVGTTDTQVLTNKDIDGGTASNSRRITIPKDTLANLQALTRKEGTVVYATDLDKLYYDDGSNLQAVGSGSGSGAKSYATEDNSTADVALGAGWTTFDDGAYPPVDGSGGTVTATFARTTSSPLQGAGSMLFTPGGQYDAAAFGFTIDRADLARMHKIEFDYEIGTYTSYTDGDVKLAVICASDSGFTTDLQVIQPAGHSIMKVAGQETHVATFQSHASNLYYRVCAVQTTASTGYTLKIDNFKVGPQSVAYGAPVQEKDYSSNFTPVGFGTVTNLKIMGNRIGNRLYLQGSFTAGTATAVTAELQLSGLTIDSGSLPTVSTQVVGDVERIGASISDLVMFYNGSTTNRIYFSDNASSGGLISTRLGTQVSNNNDTFSFNASIPILGWSSNVVVSDEVRTSDDIGQVAWFARTTEPQGYVSASNKTIGLTGADYNGGSYYQLYEHIWSMPGVTTTSTDPFSISSAKGATANADWLANKLLRVNFSTNEVFIRQDGSSTTLGGYQDSDNKAHTHTDSGHTHAQTYRDPGSLGNASGMPLSAAPNGNDVVSVQTGYANIQSSGGTESRPKNVALNAFIKYVRTTHAQIAASESVSARYAVTGSTSNTALASGVGEFIDFDTKTWDSHGSVSTGVAWKFTAPVAGEYEVKTMLNFVGGNWAVGEFAQLLLYRDGTLNHSLAILMAQATYTQDLYISGSGKIKLLAGQYIQIEAYQNSGASLNVGTNSFYNWVTVSKVGNY